MAEYRTIGALDHDAAEDAISLPMNRLDAHPEEAAAPDRSSSRPTGIHSSCRPTEKPIGTSRSPRSVPIIVRGKPRRNGSPIPKGDTEAYPRTARVPRARPGCWVRKRNETSAGEASQR